MFRSQRAVKSSVPVAGTPERFLDLVYRRNNRRIGAMTLGRGALLWLLGIPLPVILLLALFWR
jgi:hypothetical protein